MSFQKFHHIAAQAQEHFKAGHDFVMVTLVAIEGSVPQNIGAKMVVTLDQSSGTIGGGALEHSTIARAREVLASNRSAKIKSYKAELIELNLGKDLNMACGGRTRLFMEYYPTTTWTIAIFGAGHVAQAVLQLLKSLNCHVLCIDPRAEWLEQCPRQQNICPIQVNEFTDGIAHLPEQCAVIVTTPQHTQDFNVTKAILGWNKFSYLGVIGSRSKASVLKSRLKENYAQNEIDKIFSPIGLDFGNNSPEEIAISIVAQLIQERDRLV